MDSECIICIRFPKKKKKPLRTKFERKNFSRVTYIGDQNFEGKHYTQFWENKKTTGNRQKLAKNAPFASVFQNFSGRPRNPPPPPPYSERKKNPLLALYGEISPPSRFSKIGALKAKITHNFRGGGDQQAIGRNWLRMHHLHPFFKKFLGETPTPPPCCERIKTPLFGFIWSSTAKMKILPRCVYQRSELWRQKFHTIFWKKINANSAKNGIRIHHLHPFFKKFPGEAPRTPTCGRGYPLPQHLPEALRADLVTPRKWILHWSPSSFMQSVCIWRCKFLWFPPPPLSLILMIFLDAF